MKQLVSCALLGWASLFAVNFAAFFTGVLLPVSALSLLIAGLLGVPGVTLMVVLTLLF